MRERINTTPQRPSDRVARLPTWRGRVAALGIVIAIVAPLLLLSSNAVGTVVGQGATSNSEGAVVGQGATSTATPSCDSADDYLRVIAEREVQGDYAGAEANAESGLNRRELCQSARTALIAKAISSGLKVLLSGKFAPTDVDAQQKEVDRYLELRERTQEAGVEFPMTDLQIAVDAYDSHPYLARAAFERAFKAGTFRPEVHRDLLKQYISALFNLGAWYTGAQPGSELYQRGLSYLCASHRLAKKFDTGQAEAWGKLRELLGPNESDWPAPVATPLLKSGS